MSERDTRSPGLSLKARRDDLLRRDVTHQQQPELTLTCL